MVKTPDEIFRDFVVDGVPSSGPWPPPKQDIRDYLNATNPAIVADSILVGNGSGTARENKNFDEVRNLLDVLRGFAADGVTDDTAKFTALRVLYPDMPIDLRGATYKVSARPAGPFFNGWFAINNGTPVTPIDILFPAENTILGDCVPLATGERYAAWVQGKLHTYAGTIYFPWNEGTDHTAADLHPRIAKITDGGATIRRIERVLQSTSAQVTCWSAGIIDGQQVLITRENEPATAHKLWCRRVYEKRSVTVNITTTIGTSDVQVLIADHGVRSGNKVKFDANITIDGLTIIGGTEYTVTNGTSSRFYFNIGSGSASAGVTESRSFDIEFLESAFGQITFGGDSVGQEIVDIGPQTSLPSMIHGFEGVSASGGTFYVWCQGGGINQSQVKITGLLGNSPAVAKVTEISAAARAEPEGRRRPDGKFVGFCRTQASNNSPMLWFSDDDGNTFTTFINGPRETFQYSNFGVVLKDDWIIAFASGNRTGTPDVSGNYARAYVPAYILVANYDDAKVNGWDAFKVYYVGDLFHFNNISGEELNAVGIGSMCLFDDYLAIGYSTDTYDDAAAATADGDVYFARISLGSFLPEYRRPYDKAIGYGAIGKTRGGPPPTDTAWIEKVVGSTTAKAIAVFAGSTGNKSRGFGMTCVRNGTGDYTITITEPKTAVAYFPLVQPIGAGSRRHEVLSLGTGTFTVKTFGYNNGTATDSDFVVLLFMLEDFTRTGWI